MIVQPAEQKGRSLSRTWAAAPLPSRDAVPAEGREHLRGGRRTVLPPGHGSVPLASRRHTATNGALEPNHAYVVSTPSVLPPPIPEKRKNLPPASSPSSPPQTSSWGEARAGRPRRRKAKPVKEKDAQRRDRRTAGRECSSSTSNDARRTPDRPVLVCPTITTQLRCCLRVPERFRRLPRLAAFPCKSTTSQRSGADTEQRGSRAGR